MQAARPKEPALLACSSHLRAYAFGTLLGVMALGAADAGAIDYTAKFAPDFRPFWQDAEVTTVVDQWQLPFEVPNRTSVKGYKLVSTFGSPRMSMVRGHMHTATDMAPPGKPTGLVYVHAMARGVVVSIHLGAPHLTVVVKHKLENGTTLFTSYKHLHDATVRVGQTVDADTRLGRLFTLSEALALGGRYDHLHLEVRKTFEDFGVASWTTMTREGLDQRFLDPAAFLAKHLGKP
jgi:murein DD-endopeptidase MepM/ murein hydrolase activator NlpD